MGASLIRMNDNVNGDREPTAKERLRIPSPAEWNAESGIDDWRSKWEPQDLRPSSFHIVGSDVFVSKIEQAADPLSTINAAIDESRKLMDLPDNWDDEGSPPYSERTWRRATEFLRNHALWLWERHETVLEVPQILPGPNGGIDLYWKNENAELLLNIPADPAQPLTCYGDSKSGFKVSGPLSDSDYQRGLWSWIRDGRMAFDKPSGKR